MPTRRSIPAAEFPALPSLRRFFLFAFLALAPAPCPGATPTLPPVPAEIAAARTAARAKTLAAETALRQAQARLLQLEASTHSADATTRLALEALLAAEADAAIPWPDEPDLSEALPLPLPLPPEVRQKITALSTSLEKQRRDLHDHLRRHQPQIRLFAEARSVRDEAWSATFAAHREELHFLSTWTRASSTLAPPLLTQVTLSQPWRRPTYEARWHFPRDAAVDRLLSAIEELWNRRSHRLRQRDEWQTLLDTLVAETPPPAQPLPALWFNQAEQAREKAWDTSSALPLQAGEFLLARFQKTPSPSSLHPALALSQGSFALPITKAHSPTSRQISTLLLPGDSLLHTLTQEICPLPPLFLEALSQPSHLHAAVPSLWSSMQRSLESNTPAALHPFVLQSTASAALRASSALIAADEDLLLFAQRLLIQLLAGGTFPGLLPVLTRTADIPLQPGASYEVSLTFSRPVTVEGVALGDLPIAPHSPQASPVSTWRGLLKTPPALPSPILQISATGAEDGLPLDAPYTQVSLAQRDGRLTWLHYEPGPDRLHGFRLHGYPVNSSTLLLLDPSAPPSALRAQASPYLETRPNPSSGEVALAWLHSDGSLRFQSFTNSPGDLLPLLDRLPQAPVPLNAAQIHEAGLHLLFQARSSHRSLVLITSGSASHPPFFPPKLQALSASVLPTSP